MNEKSYLLNFPKIFDNVMQAAELKDSDVNVGCSDSSEVMTTITTVNSMNNPESNSDEIVVTRKRHNDDLIMKNIQKQLPMSNIHLELPPPLVLVGCILRAKDLLTNVQDRSIESSGFAAESDQAKFLLKVSYFQVASNSKKIVLNPILHRRKMIHKTAIQSSANPEWNSSFLAHIPTRNNNDRVVSYLQFSVYCMNDETRQLVFVGQHCIRIIEETKGKSWISWLPLYKWDGVTKVQGQVLVTTEVFLKSYK